MLLLDDEEPELDEQTKKIDEATENKRRGRSFKPPISNERRASLEHERQKSVSRKKSIENGVTLPNIASKRNNPK